MSTSTTEPALPPLTERINNARQAAQRVITRTLRGDPVGAERDEIDKRLAICRSCEFYRTSDGACAKCGCFIKLKARLATEECPIDRWGAQAPEPGEEQVVLDGAAVLDAELEVRDVIPPQNQLVQLLNRFHVENQQGGCRGCRRKRYVRNIQSAIVDFLNEADQEDKQRLRNIFPNTTHVLAGGKPVAWALFGVSG
jgi:hypothetical protein